ncbi:MAG: preprotein translocase subunit SecE [Zhaonellaceae bacterium]|jgi:preprotein translocase subunit SecE|nr:preprotein translocase subunit SecE [Clostridia bacterium]
MATKSASKTEKFTNRATKYFKGVWSELKKVHWPNRKELVTYTSIVLVSVFVVACVIWVVDSLFTALLSVLI